MDFEPTIDRDRLATLCRAYHVKRLAIFGSRLRGKPRPDSDLDLLVEFEEGKIPGLKFFRLQRELSSMFQREVDLNTAGFLRPSFRDEVIQTARDIYAAT